MLGQAPLLAIVEGFYGAALGLADWAEPLGRLSSKLRADHLILAANATPVLAATGVDERDLRRSFSIAARIPYDGPQLDRIGPGQATLRSSLINDTDYARTTHFNETVRPLGGFHGAVGKGSVASGAAVMACRGERRGNFAAADNRLIERLLPHLSMAIEVGLHAGVTAMLRPSLDALLQGAGEAAVVCDRSRRPVMANAAAQRLMAEGDGLGVGVAGLYGASFEDTRRLRAGFDEAERIGSARLRLNRQSGRPPLLLRLVSAWNVNLAASKGGSTVLFISEPDAPRPIDREAIAEAFHLTRREAEVAALLAGGASPAAIAQQLGVAVVSVRIYLKRIFAKTEARSQAALVAMIRGFV